MTQLLSLPPAATVASRCYFGLMLLLSMAISALAGNPSSISLTKTVALGDVNCPAGSGSVSGTNGTPITFCLIVENTGTNTFDSFLLTDSNQFFNISTNAPGPWVPGSTYTLAVRTSILGDMTNTAIAVGSSSNQPPVFDTASAVVEDTSVLVIGLDFQKTVSLGDVICPDAGGSDLVSGTMGTPITYCLNISNSGSTTITNLMWDDPQLGIRFSTNFTLAPGVVFPLKISASINGDSTNTATATVRDMAGGQSSASDSARVDDTTVLTPGISIGKTVAPGNVACPGGDKQVEGTIGDPITFCLVVTNSGDTVITNLNLSDPAIGYSFSTNATFNPGATFIATISRVITGDVINVATATGRDATGAVVQASDSATVVDRTILAGGLTLEKTVSPGSVSCPDAGGLKSFSATNGTPITYCITVSNRGSVTYTNLLVNDSAFAISLNTNLNFSPGSTLPIRLVAQITGDLTNVASVVGLDATGGVAIAASTAVVDAVQRPGVTDLTFNKTVKAGHDGCPGGGTVIATNAAPIAFCFAISNSGEVVLTNVMLHDPALGISTNLPGTFTPGSVYHLTFNTAATGSQTNQAVVQANDPTGATMSVTSSAVVVERTITGPMPVDIALSKTVQLQGGICPGGSDMLTASNGTAISYCMVVSNRGNSTFTNLTLTDPSLGVGLSTNLNLAPGQIFSVVLNSSVNGDLTNVASVVGSDTTGGVATALSTAIVDEIEAPMRPALALIKTIQPGPGTCPGGVNSLSATNGDAVTYCLIVSNTGNTSLTNISLSDPQLGIATNLTDLTAGSVFELTFHATADGSLTNTATVTGSDPTGGLHMASDSAILQVREESDSGAEVSLSKTVQLGAGMPCPGGFDFVQGTNGVDITYCLSVSNSGDSVISNLSLIDADIGFLLNTNLVLNPGSTFNVALGSTINGDLTNLATVSASGPTNTVSAMDDAVVDALDIPVVFTGSLSLVKTVGLGDFTCPGGTSMVVGATGADITYCLIVSNAGNLTLTNVMLSDPAISVNTNLPGPLTPGSTFTLTITDFIGTSLTNIATANAADATGGLYSVMATAVVQNVLGSAPILTLSKTVASGHLDSCPAGGSSLATTNGAQITYCLIASNAGAIGITLQSVVDNDLGIAVVTNLTLAPGQFLPIALQSTALSSLTNTAEASALGPTGEVLNAQDSAVLTVRATLPPAISFTKSVALGHVNCPMGGASVFGTNGASITYCLLVENTGDSIITNLTLMDPPFVNVSTNLTLAPSGILSLRLPTTVFGDFTNTATVTATDVFGGMATAVSSAVVNELAPDEPGISLIKTISDDGVCPGASDFHAGATFDDIWYCLMISNSGGVALSDVTVNDPTLGLSTNLGTFAPGDMTLLTIPDTILGDKTNTAVVSGTPAQGEAVSAMDSAIVDDTNDTGGSLGAITVTKKVSTDGTCNGVDTLTDVPLNTMLRYCIVVSNSGPVAVNNITLIDVNLNPQVSTNIASLDPGTTRTLVIDLLASLSMAATNKAAAAGTDAAGGAVMDMDSAVVLVTGTPPDGPAITLDKTISLDGACPGSDPLSAPVDATIFYCLTVRNSGDTELTSVNIFDGDLGLSTNLGALAIGAQSTIVVQSLAFSATTNMAQAAGQAGEEIVSASNTAVLTIDTSGGQGSISGQVRLDGDSDGDLSDADAGIPNVEIELWLDGVRITNTFTDASGLYAFGNLSPGEYFVIEFNPAGLTSTTDSDGINDDVIIITLGTGENRENNDFLDADPGGGGGSGTISGRVSLDGDSDGDPTDPDSGLEGIRVELYTSGGAFVAATNTAADGRYSFTGLDAGDYQLVQIDDTGFTSSGDSDGANDNIINLTLPQDGTVDNNVFLDIINPATVTSVVWQDMPMDQDPYNGDVLSEVGIEAAPVRLFIVNGGATNLLLTLNSDVNGMVTFGNLVPGDYVAEIDPGELPTVPGMELGDPTTPTRYEFSLAAGQTFLGANFGFDSTPSAVDLVAFRGASIAGGVLINWVTGSEVDNLGFNIYRSRGLSDARVKVNDVMIRGLNRASGGEYQFFDPDLADGVYFYWLEDLEFDLKSTLHGPMAVQVGDPVESLGTYQLTDPGMYFVLTAEPEKVSVFADTVELPTHLALGGVVFYLSHPGYVVLRDDVDPPLRMKTRKALPQFGMEAAIILTDEGEAEWITESNGNIMVTPVEKGVVALDVTDGKTPVVLEGKEVDTVESSGLYMFSPAGRAIKISDF